MEGEEIQYTVTIKERAGNLAELDKVSDAIWDLRGNIFADLKSEGMIPSDAEGPEHQALVDAIIRHLLNLV